MLGLKVITPSKAEKAVTPLLGVFTNTYLCYAGFEGDNTFKGGKVEKHL